jgi:hypothetical protein
LIKIISGGQTGVDRGALQAALDRQVNCGGWCPAGRKAEDGRIPAHFPVIELADAGYAQRTERNVLDSDATILIHFGNISGGSRLTLYCCREAGRPSLEINASEVDTAEAVQRMSAFVGEHQVACLNIAGPRESGAPGAAKMARQIVGELLERLK